MRISSGKASSLIGSDAFPAVADWRANGALFAYQALLARRETDPDDNGLIDRIAGYEQREWERTLLRPEVFSFLAGEPTRSTWDELRDALDADRKLVGAGGVDLMTEPGPRFTALLRVLGKGSRAESNTSASFLPPGSAEFARSRTSIAAAMDLLRSSTPGYAEDVRLVVDSIALVDDRASFRGSSGAIHRGLVFLSPDDSWTPGVFAEEILHEATHNLLDLISLRAPLIQGDDIFEERYAAPFRPDKRHVYGNLHALIVVARLICLFDGLRSSVARDELDWAARAKDYAERSLEPLDSVSAHPGLSPAARHLLDHLVTPALRQAVEAGGVARARTC
ncbi:HEXXH motif-containing putative peptide modification protein [Dactylosporangium sp. NPDC005555]|uniref:aKG-HExxH-type peptide beta-hydroxylase n=1 Tax=Dactylosporangium sp. NPDC005555 TaxID=3154889 RepID=UPI0033BC4455